MQQDHFSEGWPDIAYHILVDRHGNVYKARPTWAKGNTRTNYNPRGHLLVMCIGNFNEQAVPRRQLRGLINVLAWACARFDVRPRTIRGHRDYAATACPGNNLQRLINTGAIRRRVRERLHPGVDLDRLCGRAGRRRVNAIEEGRD
jgi:N-acetyl-anhydromuramyl-L-alanine amidase AmpD